MKTDLFQSCGQCWVFQICWHIKFSTFTASSCRIWNSSAGIPSPPLALFVVALLTSHSRMSVSRWVITHDLGCEDLFCTVLLCILATSSRLCWSGPALTLEWMSWWYFSSEGSLSSSHSYSLSCLMHESCPPSSRSLLPRASAKPSPPVAPTSLWCPCFMGQLLVSTYARQLIIPL